jgi:hypothetical protein
MCHPAVVNTPFVAKCRLHSTATPAREIHLPPLLNQLLSEVLAGHDHDQVFTGAHRLSRST